MTDPAWSAQHERRYLPLRGGLLERGLPDSLAEEIAAQAVHQARARQAEPAAANDRSLDTGAAGNQEEDLLRNDVMGIAWP